MIEPVYVDEARLDAYYAQIVTKPKVRRVPTYSLSAGLNPSIGIQGAVTQAPVSLADKLDALCEYLGGQGVLGMTRPSLDDRWDNASPDPDLPADVWNELRWTFRREICEVRTLLLPPVPGLDKGLALWVSSRPLEPSKTPRGREYGALYLIENFPDSDGLPRHISGVSLLHMFYELDMEFVAASLTTMTHDPEGPRVLDLIERGRLGPLKMVDVLYRIRGSFMDMQDEFRIATIGYPIVMLRA